MDAQTNIDNDTEKQDLLQIFEKDLTNEIMRLCAERGKSISLISEDPVLISTIILSSISYNLMFYLSAFKEDPEKFFKDIVEKMKEQLPSVMATFDKAKEIPWQNK